MRGRAALAAVLLMGACTPEDEGSRPQPAADLERPANLLFVLTDQQRRDTLGAYGNEAIRTPHLDALAEQGVVFEAAYVAQPICSPARASLLTGKYPHSHGVLRNNIPLAAEVPILVEMLPESYRTAWYGKWHLGDEIFRQHGFDDFESTEDNYDEHYSPGRDRTLRSGYHRFLEAAGVPRDRDAGYSRSYVNTLPKEQSKPAYVARLGAEFLGANRDAPFALFLSFLDPHTPFNSANDQLYDPATMEVPATYHEELDPTVLERKRAIRERLANDPPSSYVGIIDTPRDLQEVKARYWGKVTLVDEMVGRVLARLAELGLDGRTIVVYTSEHGELMGAHRMMFKSVSYQESVTVPLLLRAPGVGSGRRVEGPVSQVDLVPTLLALMGQPVPDGLEGVSWADELRSGAPLGERDVFFEFNGPPWPFKERFAERLRSVVTPQGWKLTLADDSRGELYDLNADPEERRNLFYAEEHLDRIEGLVAKILGWQERTGDEPIDFDPDVWRERVNRLR